MPPPQVSIPRSAGQQRYLFSAAYSILEEAIRQKVFPGAAFSVLSKQEILAIDGVGRFTYDSSSPYVTSSAVYDLASVTKVLATTSMAMLLSRRGELLLDQLDQPLVHWLPAFAEGEPAGGPRGRVTVAMLLAHSSGLPAYARLFETCPDSDALFEACLHMPLEAAPGTRAVYSDLGFILLGRILEIVAGEPLDRFCAREIFAPLEMTSTRFQPPADWRPFIPPTEEDLAFRGRVLQGEVQDENCFVLGGISGHAGLFSNAMDPLLYARCLLDESLEPAGAQSGSRGSLPASPQLFTPAIIRLFTTRVAQPPGSARALGWDTPSFPSSSGRFFSPHSIGHLGYSGTSFWIDFERQLAVVLLTNRTWPHRESDRIREVRPAFHDAIVKAVESSS